MNARNSFQLAEVISRRASTARHTDTARKREALADAARTVGFALLWQGGDRAIARANEMQSIVSRMTWR